MSQKQAGTRKVQTAAHTWSGIPRLKSMASQVFEKNTGLVKDSEKAKKLPSNTAGKHGRLVANIFNAPITAATISPASKSATESRTRRNARGELPRVKPAVSTTDLSRKSLPPVHIVLPGVNGSANARRQAPTKESTASDQPDHPGHRETIHLRIPGLLRKLSNGRVNKRDSLPLPPPPVEEENSSSSTSDSEPQKQVPNSAKPLPAVDLNFSRSGASSLYSVDSAEQTWNMINSIMNAGSEEDMQKARASLDHATAALPFKRASIIFPEGHYPGSLPAIPRERCEGTEAPMHERGTSTMSEHNNDLLKLSAAKTASQPRIPPDAPRVSNQVSRARSTASVFSVVIKPFKSSDGLLPLVAEDKLPLRVRKIILEQRERACFEAGLDADDDEKEIAFHEDVAYALEALHDYDGFDEVVEFDWDSDY